MSNWKGVAVLTAAMGIGCASSSGQEPAGRAAQALTKPNLVCVSWGATSSERACDDTTDVGKVHATGQSRAGGKPLTLFVLWPIDEGQEANADAIRSWFDQAKRVDAWLHDTNKDYALYERSLRAILDQKALMKASQDRLANAKKTAADAVTSAVTKSVAAIASEKAPVLAALTDVKTTVPELQGILDRARTALLAEQPTYDGLINDFLAYRATESKATAALSKIAADASSADGPRLAVLEMSLADLERAQSAAPNDLFAGIILSRARMIATQIAYDGSLAKYDDFTRKYAIPGADLVGRAYRSLGNVLAYVSTRCTAFDAGVAKVRAGLRARREALIALAADQATRDTFAKANFATASKNYLDEANARVAVLWANGETSPTLKYPLYAAKVDLYEKFLQLEGACSTAALAASSWMSAGCTAMQPSFARVRSWFADTLPGTLRMRVLLLRRKGADARLLADVETQLTAGKLKAAAVAHDAALRALDPEVSP